MEAYWNNRALSPLIRTANLLLKNADWLKLHYIAGHASINHGVATTCVCADNFIYPLGQKPFLLSDAGAQVAVQGHGFFKEESCNLGGRDIWSLGKGGRNGGENEWQLLPNGER